MRALLLLLLAAGGAAADEYVPWPPPGFHRGLFDTADGQLHYLTAGSPGLGSCLLFLPGNPRSTDEFTDVMPLLGCGPRRFCVAVDFFGCGHSSHIAEVGRVVPLGGPSQRSYAAYLAGLLSHVGVTACTPVGSMTGAGLALNFAALHPRRAPSVVLNGLYYFFPDIAPRNQAAIGMHQAFEPAVDGSHLVSQPPCAAWEERSYQPAAAGTAAARWLQQRKAVDRAGAAKTEWRTMQAYHDANGDAMLGNVSALRQTGARVLLLWGGTMFSPGGAWDDMRAPEARARISALLPDATEYVVADGHEGLMNENATAVAGAINAWLPPL